MSWRTRIALIRSEPLHPAPAVFRCIQTNTEMKADTMHLFLKNIYIYSIIQQAYMGVCTIPGSRNIMQNPANPCNIIVILMYVSIAFRKNVSRMENYF